MLDNVGDVLTRLARGTGRELVQYRKKDIEPVSEGFIVGYACTLVTPEDVTEHVTIYINTSPTAPTNENTVQLADAATNETMTAWVYPQDPALPSLPALSYPEAAGVVLAKFGIVADGAKLTMEAYRPSKRAVLRVDTGERRYFAKVVPPDQALTLHTLHAQFRAAEVPVPVSLGYSEAGLVLLDELSGVPAVERIVQIAHEPRFIESLTRLTDAIATVPVRVAARESLARRADWYADRMQETEELYAGPARAIVGRVHELYRASTLPPVTTVHGDLHLGQIFVDANEPWRIVGVLDIDTAGRGDPADDDAAVYAHVQVSGFERAAAGDDTSASAYAALAQTLRERWDNDRVRAIAATHLLGHALAVVGRADETSGFVAGRLIADARSCVGLPAA